MSKIPDRCYHLGDDRHIAFHFHTSPKENTVTVAVGNRQATVPLWVFNRDMLIISEEAAERSGK